MAGRRPIPNHLRSIRGTARADRHSVAEPTPRALKRPNPPDRLTDAAKACWRKLCALLSSMGVLTKAADMIALERTCAVYADVVRLQGVFQILGETYDTKSVSGRPDGPRPAGTRHAGRRRPAFGGIPEPFRPDTSDAREG